MNFNVQIFHQTNSLTVVARVQYSALVDDCETICFFAFQEVIDVLKKMQKLEIDFQVTGHKPQSAPKKAFN